eukprot:1030312-Prymnesium_polylepis.1
MGRCVLHGRASELGPMGRCGRRKSRVSDVSSFTWQRSRRTPTVTPSASRMLSRPRADAAVCSCMRCAQSAEPETTGEICWSLFEPPRQKTRWYGVTARTCAVGRRRSGLCVRLGGAACVCARAALLRRVCAVGRRC